MDALEVADNQLAQTAAQNAAAENAAHAGEDGYFPFSENADDYKAYKLNGYFSIFMQPFDTGYQGLDYDYVALANPKAVGPDKWTTGSNTALLAEDENSPNYLTPGSGEWARFSIVDGQSQQTLVSDAFGGPGGSNIFITTPPFPHGGGIYPFRFGCDEYIEPRIISNTNCTDKAKITSIMSDSALWSITLEIDPQDFHGGALVFRGFASAIESNSPYTLGEGTKPTTGIPFTITLYTAPEPGTFVLFGAGILGLGLHQFRRRRSSSC